MSQIATILFLTLALINPEPTQLQQNNAANSLQSMPSQTDNIDLQATQEASPQNLDQNTSLSIIGSDDYAPKTDNSQYLLIVSMVLIISGVSLLVIIANKLNLKPKSIFVFLRKEDKVDKNSNQSNG